MRRLLPVLLAVLSILAIGGWSLASGSASVEPDAAAHPSETPTTSARPETTRRCRPGTVVGASAADRALAARVTRPTVARSRPHGRIVARFGVLNVNGVPTVFGVLERGLDASCRTTWLHVQLPVKPNGTTGWVRAADVALFSVRTRVLVDLSERRVTVLRGDAPVLITTAAIGKPTTPTPTGRYYVNQRLRADDPNGAFGPGGVGISAFSPTLPNWAQGGPIAIHGTDRPDLLGAEVSHGCVRIQNEALRRLWQLAPEGTPVQIRA